VCSKTEDGLTILPKVGRLELSDSQSVCSYSSVQSYRQPRPSSGSSAYAIPVVVGEGNLAPSKKLIRSESMELEMLRDCIKKIFFFFDNHLFIYSDQYDEDYPSTEIEREGLFHSFSQGVFAPAIFEEEQEYRHEQHRNRRAIKRLTHGKLQKMLFNRVYPFVLMYMYVLFFYI
jgi:hypothetical protein